jgi:hypothetical protein
VTAAPVGKPVLRSRRRPDDDLLSPVASAGAHAAVTAAKADGDAEPNDSFSLNINPVSAAMTSADGPNNPASAIASENPAQYILMTVASPAAAPPSIWVIK